MNGPSVQFDTDASSSLAILETGAVALDERKVNSTLSCCVGICMVLTPLTWIHRVGLGQMSPFGRCFAFDNSASGWIKAEGGGAIALDNLTEKIEGVNVVDDSRDYLGTFGSVVLTHAGQAASLGTPHGPAEQELMIKACREARVAPASVDAVEAFADAMMMGDAVEMASCKKVMCDGARPPLGLTSVKSNYGNNIQGSGMMQIFKVLYGQAYGWQVPTVHLRQINPQVDDAEGLYFNDENVLFPTRTSLVAVNSIGWGGTLGACLCSCGIDREKVAEAKPAHEKEALIFWPGGGGEELDEPAKGYFIVGSWNGWDGEVMEKEGPGVYGFLITLGANRIEEFQILFDGDPDKVLHPTVAGAPSGMAIVGPDEDGTGCTWAIDGRVLLYSLEEGNDMSNLTSLMPLEGAPAPGTPEGYFESTAGIGDQYWVRLCLAGKYRVVTWERVYSPDNVASVLTDPSIQGKYYISADWNLWSFTELPQQEGAPGTHSIEVRLMRDGGNFQIVRNRDRSQVLHPPGEGQTRVTHVLGPEYAEIYACWSLEGSVGDVFRIEFQRNMERGVDSKGLTWTKVRVEPLNEQELFTARRTRFSVIGTMNRFVEAHEMAWTGTSYDYVIEVGDSGKESFQILVEGNTGMRLFPSVPDATTSDKHSILQGAGGSHWTIGVDDTEVNSAGKSYKVSLTTTRDGRPLAVNWAEA